MKNNIKVIAGNVIGIAIGAVVSGIGVYATLTYNAGDIAYTKSGASTPISVSSALNELYQNKKETTDDVKNVTANGSITLDKYYKNLNVNVPIPAGYIQPSGTQNITSNGNYDITNKANVNVNVTVAGTKTLLWTNTSPNSDFTKQTLSLSSPLSNFTHILIEWKNEKSSSVIYDDLFNLSPARTYTSNTGIILFGGIESIDSSTNIYVRSAYMEGETIRVTSSIIRNGTTKDDSRCIPVAIYGMNMSY